MATEIDYKGKHYNSIREFCTANNVHYGRFCQYYTPTINGNTEYTVEKALREVKLWEDSRKRYGGPRCIERKSLLKKEHNSMDKPLTEDTIKGIAKLINKPFMTDAHADAYKKLMDDIMKINTNRLKDPSQATTFITTIGMSYCAIQYDAIRNDFLNKLREMNLEDAVKRMNEVCEAKIERNENIKF